MIHILNNLINSCHYKKKFVKIVNDKNIKKLIPTLLKINIIKHAVLKKNVWYLFLTNNQYINIVRFSKPTESMFIGLNELVKLRENKKCIFVMSTNQGIITDIDALKLKIGGLLLFSITH